MATATDEPVDYTLVVHIENLKTAVLRGALWSILAKIDEQHLQVSHILTDNEGTLHRATASRIYNQP